MGPNDVVVGQVVTWDEVEELGLEAAPEGIGPSDDEGEESHG